MNAKRILAVLSAGICLMFVLVCWAGKAGASAETDTLVEPQAQAPAAPTKAAELLDINSATKEQREQHPLAAGDQPQSTTAGNAVSGQRSRTFSLKGNIRLCSLNSSTSSWSDG